MVKLLVRLCFSGGFLVLILAFDGRAETGKKTSVYESSSAAGFTAKVKNFKDSRGDNLVYFEELKKSGPYVLSGTIKDYTTFRNRIAKSATAQGAKVTVSIDDQDSILNVTGVADSP